MKFGLCLYRWGFWFRIFGRGFSVMYDRPRTVLFSERYGYRKVWRFGPMKIVRLEVSL